MVYLIPLTILLNVHAALAEPIAPIARRLPPPGTKLNEDTLSQLKKVLAESERRLASFDVAEAARLCHENVSKSDVAVLLHAVRLAIRHGEFYQNDDDKVAQEMVHLANLRMDAHGFANSEWHSGRGLTVRGYRSSIDGSVQPYGLEIPEKLDLSKPVPLYVWLHGRGDKVTNLAFIHQRLTKPGKINVPDAIVLHPFGRQCIGFKSAGEIDVLEAIEHVAANYNIDRRRIVLMGFSMGGAGVWHIGAHYPDRFVAMSPGAGFAETARYAKVDRDATPAYEQKLWGVYDVPCYTSNLFNLPVVAYSGENDKQIQAARVMEEAFAGEGQRLNHKIGPGMGHKYHPDTLAAILKEMKAARDRGLELSPQKVTLQTRTLRYHKVHWVDVQGLERHWEEARVDAELADDGTFQLATKNVSALRLTPEKLPKKIKVVVDGQSVEVVPRVDDNHLPAYLVLVKENMKWRDGYPDQKELAKRPGLQGPIDDAFLSPFLVVLPSGKCRHPAVQRWVDFESAHFLDRWQAAFRGQARVKKDSEVTAEDIKKYNLILWGDPAANTILARVAKNLPINWNDKLIKVDEKRQAPAASHVLAMIYPNPEAPRRYVVLNSGPTFREGHDRTNSLQNPKLPDWAVIDLSSPPDGLSPGRIFAADFFDERWQVRTAE